MATPERTPDGRHVVVGGRRWRASDPSLDPTVRQALVDELMAARRQAAVRALARAWEEPVDADPVQAGAEHVVSDLPAEADAARD